MPSSKASCGTQRGLSGVRPCRGRGRAGAGGRGSLPGRAPPFSGLGPRCRLGGSRCHHNPALCGAAAGERREDTLAGRGRGWAPRTALCPGDGAGAVPAAPARPSRSPRARGSPGRSCPALSPAGMGTDVRTRQSFPPGPWHCPPSPPRGRGIAPRAPHGHGHRALRWGSVRPGPSPQMDPGPGTGVPQEPVLGGWVGVLCRPRTRLGSCTAPCTV